MSRLMTRSGRNSCVKQGPLDTTAGLSMPFWGMDCGGRNLTYIVTNPFNNELSFKQEEGKLTVQFTHTFTPNQKVKQYGLRIGLGGPSPVGPAKFYRKYLIEQGQFVSLNQKRSSLHARRRKTSRGGTCVPLGRRAHYPIWTSWTSSAWPRGDHQGFQ